MTPIFQTSAEWGKAIDHSTADEKTKQLMELGMQNLQRHIAQEMKSSEMIAAIVKEIILGKNTDFRCFTNAGFLDEEIAAKLKDPASDESIEYARKRFFGDKKEEN